MRMMAKLNTNAKSDGLRGLRANHNSRVERIPSDAGILMSMIRSVSAMAKTPSQNASSRVLGCGSVMGASESGSILVAKLPASKEELPRAACRLSARLHVSFQGRFGDEDDRWNPGRRRR